MLREGNFPSDIEICTEPGNFNKIGNAVEWKPAPGAGSGMYSATRFAAYILITRRDW